MKNKSASTSTARYSSRLFAITMIPVLLVLVLVTARAYLQNENGATKAAIHGLQQGKSDARKAKDKKAQVEDYDIAAQDPTGSSPSPNLVTATTYPFTSSAGAALEDMSSGTTQLIGINVDDVASAVTNIGFEFWYDGVRFTQFSVNSNGLCRLGSLAIGTQFDNDVFFESPTNAPKIAPYFDDIQVGNNGKVHFKVIGSAPSRKLVVEWLNMQIPLIGAGFPGAGTFQMWLSETTGLIEFVYGSGVGPNGDQGGYSIGLQSGAPTNFASVTSLTATVSYATSDNTQTNAIASGTKYRFTPNVPNAPTALSFTSVTQTSMILNWADNATNEFGYAVYQSTDGTNFTFVVQTAANATSRQITELDPSTTYFFRVLAVTEGALSSALSGSQMTLAAVAINSTAAGGVWSSPSTWAGGVVPSSGSNVTIADGSVVTIDTAASALSVIVGQGGTATLQFDAVSTRTLTVGQSVTITSNSTFQSASTGTVTAHNLSVGRNLTNNGTLDFSTNADTAGANITFTTSANATFSGAGAVTDIRSITMNKGLSSASVLELMPSNFTVRGTTTDSAAAGYLTLTNGTFKISGTFTANLRTFATAAYTISPGAGFWLNNPNYTVTGQNGSPVNFGLLRLTQGVFNIGNTPNNAMTGGGLTVFVIEGGTLNAAGRLSPTGTVSYTQTGGTINANTVGNSSATNASFELSGGSSFTMSGGTINLINPSTGSPQIDYRVTSPVTNVTGGLLVVGAAGAPASSTYQVQGSTPSITINPTMTLAASSAIPTPLRMRGTTVVNNGSIISSGATARFDFQCNTPMTYTGGTFGTLAAPFEGAGISSNTLALVTLNSPIVTTGVNLFSGGFVNSNLITLGNGGTSMSRVQIGGPGLITTGGSFDVSPIHNQGTGGQIVTYSSEITPRTTGVEVNPTRILTVLTVDNPFNVTLSGGDITVTSPAAAPDNALELLHGRFITGANTLIMSDAASVVTRLIGYVDGNFRKTFSAPDIKTFEVGTANGFSPVDVNVTAGTFPAAFTAKAVQGPQPNFLSPHKALQRYWKLTGTGITADLTFNYLDPPDVPGTATESAFVIFKYNGAFTTPGGSVDTVANTATISGVSSFSDWTVAEPSAPTAIELVSLTATEYDAGTHLQWQTGFETSNLGFNIYRDEGGRRVQVNAQLIGGSALLAGSNTVLKSGNGYSWWISRARSKSITEYWLEDVDLNGQSTWHGPIAARQAGGSPPATSDAAVLSRVGLAESLSTSSGPVERGAALTHVSQRQPELQAAVAGNDFALAGKPAVKISVRQEGWYRVPGADLLAAGLNAKADPQMLQMYVDGRQIPIKVIATQKQLVAVEFYGRGIDAPSTDARVYWLVAGAQPGLRVSQVQGEGYPAVSGSFLCTVERRERTIYFASLRNGEKENFFGAVIARDPVDQTFSLAHVDQTSSSQVQLEVSLQGVTLLPHQVWVYLNGTFAGEVLFNGQSEGTANFSVSQTVLREGDNQVRLVAQRGASDVSLVDHMRLSYWHSFAADNNSLRLTVPGNQQVTINGFTSGSIRVFDVTDPDAAQELAAKIEQQKTSYAVRATSPTAGDRQLLAIADDLAARPAKIAANQISDLRTTSHAADLVMIAPRELFSSIEPLRALRSNQGMKVEVVDIEDIYDEFGFGNASPQALKDFLLFATTSWKTKPRYLLLVGDASLDPRNHLGFGNSDIVPTGLIDTAFMETASDDWLADFNGDGIAELAIGRLPARTREEAATMVQKIIRYDGSEPLGSMLLVADINSGFDFESAAARLRSLIPRNLRVDQINRSDADDSTTKIRLIDAIGRGQKVVNYMGHGSANSWNGGLLTNEDATNLANGERLPVFVMMTCLNGYFHDPALDSLAESLMKAKNGGAVAVWTSAAMTEPMEQSVLNQKLYQLLFAGGGKPMTLGEATAKAKTSVRDGDIRRTWVLLGDPTMKLK